MDGLRTAAGAALDAAAGNVAFARAALGAGVPVWADRPARPRAFHVVHPCGMSLVWGPDVAAAHGAVADHLRARRRAEWLQVEPRWADLDWDGALGAVPADGDGARATGCVRHARVGLALDPRAHAAYAAGAAGAAGEAGATTGTTGTTGTRGTTGTTGTTAAAVARAAAHRVPPGWRVRPATAADFAWPGTVVPAGYWPDAGAFLAAGGGVVAERDGVVGAMAFTAFRDGVDQEIGIETDPAHRRQGLAGAAAAALVAQVVAAGRTPVWSCREGNAGSVALARALGFVPVSRAPYWHLP